MAKELSKSGISTGQDILAGHVTQSIDAFTGIEAYDVTVSGSLTITGSTIIQPTNVDTGTNVLTVDSSGKIYKTGSYSAGGGGATPTWQQVTYQGASTTNDLTITANITASGNISASGILYGTNLNLSGYAELGESGLRLRESPGLSATGILQSDAPFRSAQYLTSTNVTASSNISTSGIVYGETGSFSHLQGNSPITVGDEII